MLIKNKVGGNFFTGLSTFDNHITFVLGKGKKNIGDEFAGGSASDVTHIENMNRNTTIE